VSARRALRADIAAALEEGILTGTLRPGQRLLERELVERFRVSTIPVREALHELEARGLVVKQHARGCTVVALTDEEVRRACDARRLLEPAVAGWAAERLDRGGARQLEIAFDALAAAGAAGDVPGFFREDLRLHRTIWELSGNAFAARALESTVGSLFASSLQRAQQTETLDLRREVARHRALVVALVAGDPARAAEQLGEIVDALERVTTGAPVDAASVPPVPSPAPPRA
jgi:DNA-binding GntR family transcriptional regulator